MQNIPFHIAYLLTQNHCVIVPGLGAFIVYPLEKEKKRRWGILSPPENYLSFNPEINYPDELLANSIAKELKCSHEEACNIINNYVSEILLSFEEGKNVHIPLVGSLFSKDNKILFQPDRSLSCNASNFGLTGFSFRSLQDIQKEQNSSNKKNIIESAPILFIRKFLAFAIPIAAAIIAIFVIPDPLNDALIEPVEDHASILYLPEQVPIIEEADATEILIPEPTDTIAEIFVEVPDIQIETANQTEAGSSKTSHYYVIVASLPDRISAQKTILNVKSSGFENAAILSTDGKHRIYINRFEDKTEADKFLIKFRKDNPKYANAWILKYIE